MSQDIGADVNTWTSVLRRARLDRTTKLVGLTLATYANPDGTKIYPGLARLVVQCRIGYGTARRALALLRAAGLVEIVKRGNRRRGRSDEYRLILAEDLLERVHVLTPDEERDEISAIAERTAAAGRARQRKVLALSQVSANESISANDRPGLALTTDPPPSIGPLPPKPNPPSIPAGWPGSTHVDRDSARRAGPTGVAGELDLAMDGWNRDRRRKRPFAELQHAYDEGRIDDNDMVDKLDELLDGLDPAEERTAEGMLGNGVNVKAIYNTIRKDRRTT